MDKVFLSIWYILSHGLDFGFLLRVNGQSYLLRTFSLYFLEEIEARVQITGANNESYFSYAINPLVLVPYYLFGGKWISFHSGHQTPFFLYSFLLKSFSKLIQTRGDHINTNTEPIHIRSAIYFWSFVRFENGAVQISHPRLSSKPGWTDPAAYTWLSTHTQGIRTNIHTKTKSQNSQLMHKKIIRFDVQIIQSERV